jgi:hypothetical protein
MATERTRIVTGFGSRRSLVDRMPPNVKTKRWCIPRGVTGTANAARGDLDGALVVDIAAALYGHV